MYISFNIDETIENCSSSGRLFSSKFKNRSPGIFAKEEKFRYPDRKVPGPGQYDNSKT